MQISSNVFLLHSSTEWKNANFVFGSKIWKIDVYVLSRDIKRFYLYFRVFIFVFNFYLKFVAQEIIFKVVTQNWDLYMEIMAILWSKDTKNISSEQLWFISLFEPLIFKEWLTIFERIFQLESSLYYLKLLPDSRYGISKTL